MRQITIINRSNKFNIMVNDHQIINDTLMILCSKGLLSTYDHNYVKNMRNSELVNTKLTFNDGNVLNGDELEIDL